MSACRSMIAALILAGTVHLAQAQTVAVPDPDPGIQGATARQARPPETAYLIYYDGKQWGPYTFADLMSMAEKKEFFLDDLVWKDGATKWLKASDYPELAAIAVEPPQPPKPKMPEVAKPEVAEPEIAKPEVVKPDIAAAPETPEAVAEAGKPEPGGPVAEAEAEGPDVPPPPPDDLKAVVTKPAKQYFVSVSGASTGPFTLEEVKQKIIDGTVTTGTYVWWKGAAWTQAGEVAELASTFPEVPEPPPFDCEGHLVGTWERGAYFSGQYLTTRTRHERGGRYGSVQWLPGTPGINAYGTWTAKAVGAKTCAVTLRQQFPNNQAQTIILDIVDQNTMTDKADNTIVRRL